MTTDDLKALVYAAVFMLALLSLVLFIADIGSSKQAKTYQQECNKVNGNAVFNGKYWECLK